jgi:ribosomal protein S18 acetylase RimI-like enzyme
MSMGEQISVERLGPFGGAELARALEDLIPKQERQGPLPSARYLGDLLASPATYVFLARWGQVPVGYLSAYRFPRLDQVGDQVYLFDIEVDSAARRRGIGRQLVERLLDACRADTVPLVWAGTALDNVAAQRTFEAAGGRRISETYVEYEFSPAEL